MIGAQTQSPNLSLFTHSGHHSGQLFKKHFLEFARVLMGKLHIHLFSGPWCIILCIATKL